MAFTPKELDLAPGESWPAELFVPGPASKAGATTLGFAPGKGLSVEPDARWNGKVPAWGTKVHPRVTAAPDAEGEIPVAAALEKTGGATLLVRVAKPKVEPVPGTFKLTVRIGNPFRTRLMTGRVVASNPDRFLEDITAREFRIAPGKTEDVVFPLPGAAPAPDETYNFTIGVDTYAGYHEQKTYPLVFPPTTDPNQP